MSNKDNKIKQYIPILFFMIIGAICGVLIIRYIESVEKSTGEIIFSAIILLIGIYVAIFLQIIIHEGGHLIFGLLTGYGFSSFRVGSIMWIKVEEKIKFRKLSLAGTGGQCLLTPPEIKDGKFPYVLYNLGGCIVNFISALIFAWIALSIKAFDLLSLILLIISVVGIGFALLNGIPMRLGAVDNDGYNAFSLGKDKEALRAFWIQLKVNEKVSTGVRLKDMPNDWFEIPSNVSMRNSITATIGVLKCSRLMDQMKFEESDQLMQKLLGMETGIVGLYRNLMVVDRIYCELVGENRRDILNKMLDKEQKKFMKAMKNFPSVIRTKYAYAIISEKNYDEAAGAKKMFEKVALRYPHPSEIAAERQLMDYASSL